MSQPSPELTVEPDELVEALPEPPAPWSRTVNDGGIVEYRIAGEDGICAAAKLLVRPELFEASAVRVDRTQGCQSVGTTRHDDIADAVEAVTRELAAGSTA